MKVDVGAAASGNQASAGEQNKTVVQAYHQAFNRVKAQSGWDAARLSQVPAREDPELRADVGREGYRQASRKPLAVKPDRGAVWHQHGVPRGRIDDPPLRPLVQARIVDGETE